MSQPSGKIISVYTEKKNAGDARFRMIDLKCHLPYNSLNTLSNLSFFFRQNNTRMDGEYYEITVVSGSYNIIMQLYTK